MAEFTSSLADVSAIWLVFLSFILCLVPLAIFGAMVYGMRKVLIALPPILKQGQKGIATVSRETDRVSKKIAQPFIVASASANQVKGTVRGLTKLVGGQHDVEE
jgi:hypothetical protein